MSDEREIKITKPNEGAGTLVARFSFLQCDEIVAELKAMRKKNESEEKILKYLANRARDIDEGSRKKLYQLSRGETPKDDITLRDLEKFERKDNRTLEIVLGEDSENFFSLGALVFFEGHRWIVTELVDRRLSLKKF